MIINALAPNRFLLRNVGFDGLFIFGSAAIGIAAGTISHIAPSLFGLIFLLNIWLFGYHHVIATYTRVLLDAEGYREHRWVVLYLPVAVVASVAVVWNLFGPWAVTSIYLYWQWWHYTRQSEGVAKTYAAKAKGASGDPLLTRLTFYGVPTVALINLFFTSPNSFLSYPVYTPSVSAEFVVAANSVGIVLLLAWFYDQWKVKKAGGFSAAYFSYMTTHFTIYIVAYIIIDEIDHGWLVINMWHNVQYLAFVWLYNTNRFREGVDEKSRFLSRLCQPGMAWAYFGFTLLLTTVIYTSVDFTISTAVAAGVFPLSAFSITVIIYQSLNFHHYVTDTFIWKLRKRSYRQTLAID